MLAAGAGGQAIASTMDEEEIDRLAQENAGRLSTEPRQLAARIHEARLQGYSVNMYRRTSPGITALGIPIIGAYGQCVAGIGVIAVSSRLYGKRRIEVLDWMRAEAAGDRGPWRQQAILGRGRWEADALRDIVREYSMRWKRWQIRMLCW